MGHQAVQVPAIGGRTALSGSRPRCLGARRTGSPRFIKLEANSDIAPKKMACVTCGLETSLTGM